MLSWKHKVTTFLKKCKKMPNFASRMRQSLMVTSPYRRGADDGFIFGLYLSLMFFGSIFAPKLPLLGLLSFAMMIAVPAVIFIFMRRYDRQLQECATFPMFWMQGVVIFICGILISGALLVVYLQWFDTDYIRLQMESMAELGESPEAKGTVLEEAGSITRRMLDARFIPSPIAIVTELIMAAIVSGSLLSIILGCFFALRNKLRRRARQ